MKTFEVNETMIGCRVKCAYMGWSDLLGTIIAVVEDKYMKGVRIKLDKPVYYGYDSYDEFDSTARKCDEGISNLQYTELI